MLVVNPDASVLTIKGYKPANKLVLGDSLISRGDMQAFANYDISQIRVSKNRELCKIVTEESSVCVSPNTFVLCKRPGDDSSGFIEASCLKEGDLVALNVERNHVEPTNMSLGIKMNIEVDEKEEKVGEGIVEYVSKQYIDNSLYEKAISKYFWWICGVYLALGEIREGVGVIEAALNLFNVVLALRELEIDHDYYPDGEYEQIIIKDRVFCEFLKNYIGEGDSTKTVHSLFMRLPLYELSTFVDGWKDAKIWYTRYDKCETTVQNEQVAYSMQVCRERIDGKYAVVHTEEEKITYFTLNLGDKKTEYESKLGDEPDQFWTKITEISDVKTFNSVEITCMDTELCYDAICYVNNFVVF